MNINTKLKHTAISLVIALILAVSAAPVLPAYAAVGTSVNEEVVNQARSVASIIQTRIQLYWSDWVDKQIPYTQDPLTNPAPTWATDAEIAGLVGGATPDGMTFTVEGMPVARDGSFYLVATVDSSMGGAAAASYVRNFLPMAIAASNSNVVKIPVLRPSFALGLSDIANNPNKVNRDGTTDDGEPTFTDGANITFGDNGSITFDPVTGGNINNVNNLDARNITVSDTLTTNTANITGNAAIDGDLTVGGNITGDLTGNTTGTHTGAVIGNVTGNVTGNLTGNVTGNSSTATRLATARTIALNTGATGTATAFSGAANISIPVTALNAGYLNAGTVPIGRLTGDYGINITGKATTAGLADTAKYANGAGLLKDTDGEAAGAFTIKPLSGGYIEFGGASAPTVVKFGATGTVQPTEYQFGLNGDAVLRGIATSATKLAAAKSIALGTAATGTATIFDNTKNITIPITALNAGYLNAGTILTARLSGTYNIGISGKAATAGAADTAVSAATATSAASAGKLSASRDFNVTGAASGTAASFDGTGNVNIAVNSLDPTKLVNVGANNIGVRYDLVSFNANTFSLTGAIKITLPAGVVDMLNIEIDVYEYNEYGASKITVGGHQWTSHVWHNPSVSIHGKYNKGIRLAYDGNSYCIILGNATTVWQYPKVNVAKITGGYNNTVAITGTWTAGLLTDESGLMNIVAPAVSGSTATKLAVARTIALGTGATGTATAFDGSANITIPVTALNAGYLNAGTIPTARLSGSYGIDISGTARYAQELSSPISSVAYATSAGTAGQLVPTYGAQSSYTETAVNVNIVGTPNDRDTWIYRDAATGPTGTNWGIYMRNIDSAVGGLPANSIGFVGNSILRAYINLGDGSAGFNSTVSAPVFSGSLSGNASSATTVTTPSGTYKHLGAWGVGRTAAGAILVNTAYTADVAGYATSSGYASSAGSVSGAAIIDAASSGNPSYIRFTNGFKIITGSTSVAKGRTVTVAFPIAFSTNNFGTSCSGSTYGYIKCSGSTASITLYNPDDTAGSAHWIAAGY